MAELGIRQAVILCGGLGTRMGELTRDLPKPMLPVNGKPVLEYTMALLKEVGITDVIFAARYKSDVIENHFGDGSKWGMKMRTSVEPEPMGTAGPLTLIKDELEDDFMVLFGDEFIDFDIAAMIKQHLAIRPVATILTRPSTHPWDSHLVQTDDTGRIVEFVIKHEEGKRYRNLGNGSIYVLSKKILDYIPEGRKSMFSEEIFPSMIASGAMLQSWTLTSGYIKDLANPDRLKSVEKYLRHKQEIEDARIERKPIKAVFLDRDGVINEDSNLIDSPERLVMLPGAAQAIKLLNDNDVRTIVVTNQPVVARGLCDEETLAAIHDKLHAELSSVGAKLDAIYYCPHHPETHHGEGVVELRRACDCRKPNPGMLLKAKDEHGLDLGTCVMIGDSSSDIAAGRAAGVRTVLLQSGQVLNTSLPDYTYTTLLDAARAIVNGDIR